MFQGRRRQLHPSPQPDEPGGAPERVFKYLPSLTIPELSRMTGQMEKFVVHSLKNCDIAAP